MLRLKLKEVYGAVIVEVGGNLMGGPGADAEKFREVIKTPLDEGKRNFVVNLHKVKWANSLGVGILIGVLTSVRKAGGEMVLSHVTDRIVSVLVTTQLIKVFETFDSDDEAAKYLMRHEEHASQI
jgi:anti-sigma B factor antagonist